MIERLIPDSLINSTQHFLSHFLSLPSHFIDHISNYTLPITHFFPQSTIIIIFFIFFIFFTIRLSKPLYTFLFLPFNRIKQLGSVGFDPHQVIEAVIRRRSKGDLPPVYPNGWFAVIESRDLSSHTPKSVYCLGKNLAVFRDADGLARVLDAYCPHNGANLAVGGVVKNGCIECPFHGWRFQGDGKCVHIPYADKIPSNAKVKAYETREQNGFVLMWYHAEDEAPLWFPHEIAEIREGRWKYAGRSEHAVNAHIQEIPENGADPAHLGQVHSPIMWQGANLSKMRQPWCEFIQHNFTAQWRQDGELKHVGQMDLKHQLMVAGRVFPLLDLNVVALQIGPGLVHLLFDSKMLGKGAYIQTITPTEPLMQKMVHHIYVRKWVPNLLAKFFLYGESLMVERDIMVWNNKRYVSKPLWVKSQEDSLVAKHRRWFSQFYSDNSPRLNIQSVLLNDW